MKILLSRPYIHMAFSSPDDETQPLCKKNLEGEQLASSFTGCIFVTTFLKAPVNILQTVPGLPISADGHQKVGEREIE